MMLNNAKSEQLNAELVIDTIIGYNDQQKKESKQVKSKRVLEARRAIEQHRERKELSQDLNDYWLSD